MIDATAHLGLVRAVAVREGVGWPVEDSEEYGDGCVGLAYAAQNYDPDLTPEFSTYAYQCIRYAIRDGRRWRRLGGGWGAPKRYTPTRLDRLGRVPPDVSLTRLLDPAAPPEDRDGLERSELLAALLRHCDDRERRLLVQTLGAGITYESAGRAEVPPISKERVRQILLRAVLRLRRAARDMGLPAPVTWSTNLQHRAGR